MICIILRLTRQVTSSDHLRFYEYLDDTVTNFI